MKNCIFQAFTVPSESGSEDSENDSPEKTARKPRSDKGQSRSKPAEMAKSDGKEHRPDLTRGQVATRLELYAAPRDEKPATSDEKKQLWAKALSATEGVFGFTECAKDADLKMQCMHWAACELGYDNQQQIRPSDIGGLYKLVDAWLSRGLDVMEKRRQDKEAAASDAASPHPGNSGGAPDEEPPPIPEEEQTQDQTFD